MYCSSVGAPGALLGASQKFVFVCARVYVCVRVRACVCVCVYIKYNKPDICIIDDANGRAFIVKIANPFDYFIDMCYQQKFEKDMPLCLAFSGFSY